MLEFENSQYIVKVASVLYPAFIPPKIHKEALFIQSLVNKYLLNTCYVSGIVLGTENPSVNETYEVPDLKKLKF